MATASEAAAGGGGGDGGGGVDDTACSVADNVGPASLDAALPSPPPDTASVPKAAVAPPPLVQPFPHSPPAVVAVTP